MWRRISRLQRRRLVYKYTDLKENYRRSLGISDELEGDSRSSFDTSFRALQVVRAEFKQGLMSEKKRSESSLQMAFNGSHLCPYSLHFCRSGPSGPGGGLFDDLSLLAPAMAFFYLGLLGLRASLALSSAFLLIEAFRTNKDLAGPFWWSGLFTVGYLRSRVDPKKCLPTANWALRLAPSRSPLSTATFALEISCLASREQLWTVPLEENDLKPPLEVLFSQAFRAENGSLLCSNLNCNLERRSA